MLRRRGPKLETMCTNGVAEAFVLYTPRTRRCEKRCRGYRATCIQSKESLATAVPCLRSCKDDHKESPLRKNRSCGDSPAGGAASYRRGRQPPREPVDNLPACGVYICETAFHDDVSVCRACVGGVSLRLWTRSGPVLGYSRETSCSKYLRKSRNM